MQQKLRWEVGLYINAPVTKVWHAIEDLTLIPKFHPDVREVEYLSGETKRAPGVAYKCIIPDGRRKGWCVEQVVENIPNQKMSVTFGEDSWGLSQMFSDFLTEITLESRNNDTTMLDLKTYYNPIGLKMKLLNSLFMKWLMRRRTRQTLQGFKHLLENQSGEA